MRPVLAYTAARIGIFLATLAVLYISPWPEPFILKMAIAVLVSGIASYVLLSRQRDAVSSVLTKKTQGRDDDVDAS